VSFSGELLVLVCGILALITAFGTVALRSPLRAAMALLGHIISLAGLYLTLNAHLLAAIQILVYAGAIVVLFVFVIMLIGPSALGSRPDQRGLIVKTIGTAVIVMTMGTVAFGVAAAGNDVERPLLALCEGGVAECSQFGGVDAMAEEIYLHGAIPFELVSMLLLVAILAAIAVARGGIAVQKKAIDPAALPVRPTVLDPPGPSLNNPNREAAE
jgi:NADH-quinone oxidoreductase subunit J